MRRDGRPFISGGETARPFSDALAERPFDAYVPPERRKEAHAIDEAPRPDELAAPSPLANRGFAHLKGQ